MAGLFDFFTTDSGDTTVDDFDNWGMTPDWSSTDESVWNEPTNGGNWFTDVFGIATSGVNAYYDAESNRAIRQANLDQIRLQNSIPQPINVTAPPVASNNDTALVAGAIVLAGVALLSVIK